MNWKVSNFVKKELALLISLIMSLVGLHISAVSAAIENKKQINKPNFVWIISEDNSPKYLRLYDPVNGAAMPNIESMAKQGVTYENAYSNAPVCSTARSTLALGVYAPQAGTMHHRAFARAKYNDNDNGLKSIYQLMKESGYYVTNNSKTDFNFTNVKGSDFFESSSKSTWLNRKESKPFFHVKTFTTTHESKLMFPVSDVENKPTRHDPKKVKLASIHPDTDLFRYSHARYLDLHQDLDKQVGGVIAELKQAGELENTFVFYFGDHGGVLPGSKSFANESGLKTPLVVRLPKNYQHLLNNNTSAGMRSNDFVSFVDMAPTLLHLSGADKSPLHSGQAFLGKNIPDKKELVFGYADRFGERYDLVRTIRVGNYKYVRNYLPMNPDGLEQNYRFKNVAYQQWRDLYKKGQLNKIQSAFFKEKSVEALYDLSKDPEELSNLASVPAEQTRLLNMRSRLQQHIKLKADLGFVSESWLESSDYSDSLQLASSQYKQINKAVDAADLMILPFIKAKPELTKLLDSGSKAEKYWALVSLSVFAEQAIDLAPQAKQLLKLKHTSNLVKARAIEFLARIAQMDPEQPLTSLIEHSTHQLEALEMMNIAAALHDTRGYQFEITPRPEWSELPAKTAVNYMPKKYQNGSVKVRIEYLKTPWIQAVEFNNKSNQL